MSDQTKFLLAEEDIPKAWYNLKPDLPFSLPPVLHPGTKAPVGPEDLAPLFPLAVIQQEVSRERWIEIPEPVRDVYRLWRPSPLFRAHRLEKALQTPAKVFYKYEGVSPAGSHKPNTAVAQAFYNREEGTRRIATETGAGQWGSALALACQMFGIELKVYMVKVSYQQKPYRRHLMETWGARVVASPSSDTNAGRQILARDPECAGSLGMAIAEAVEDAVTGSVPTKYALGSVLEHVLLHQSVIGLETKRQMDLAGAYPDVVVGCIGGGSNFAGFAYPFLQDKLTGKASALRVLAVEPAAAPSLTRGVYAYDYGDTSGLTPLVKMFTLGHGFVPEPIHAGGLRYHGMASSICELYRHKIIEARAVPQRATFEAGVLFARTEGILPAPEAAHAIRGAMDEAVRCREEGVSRTIVFNLCGHGHFDLSAYEKYLSGQIEDYELPQGQLDRALQELPVVAEKAEA
jgi:tryptophan synthase beta chain